MELDSDAFVAEVRRIRGKKQPLSAAALKSLRDEHARTIDFVGLTLLTAAVFALAFGLNRIDAGDLAGSLGSLEVWPFLLAGAVLAPVFWRWESRQAPRHSLRQLSSRAGRSHLPFMSVDDAFGCLPSKPGVGEASAAWAGRRTQRWASVIRPRAGNARTRSTSRASAVTVGVAADVRLLACAARPTPRAPCQLLGT